MLLSQIRLFGSGAFEDLAILLDDPAGSPRRLAVLFGGEGVGKTSILSAVAMTRPGHAVAPIQPSRPGVTAPAVITDWLLGDDDPARPHPLRVMSPNARLTDERDDAVLLRRREQALFDKRATEGGFALVAFSGARWFSRSPVLLSAPDRTLSRYDVRATASFDDATRADLARETKQVLAFAAIAASLSQRGSVSAASAAPGAFEGFERSLGEVIAVLLEGTGITYLGVDPARLEPLFDAGGREVELDDLPRSARHRVAFGALTLRAVAAAYPGKEPREAEGVALLDDIEVQQDLSGQRVLPGLLKRALPRVQWIVTTGSPAVALGCEVGEVLALRRLSATGRVELFQGEEAVMH